MERWFHMAKYLQS